jgi:hypothetical protein
MSGNSLKSAATLLRTKFSGTHVDAALKHFSATIEKFVSGDWEGTSQKAGKFVEAVTKALMLHCGKTVENPRKFSAGREMRALESAGAYSEVIRLVIPRAGIFVYDIVSNRGGRHDPHDVDANEMDATTIVPMISWMLAEMVRFCSGSDPATAMSLIKELATKTYPYFEEIDGRPYVNLDGNPGDIAILLLYSRYPRRTRRQDLVNLVVRHGHTQSAATSAVHRLKSVIDDDDGEWVLRGKGREQAEVLLKKISTKKAA